MFPTVKVAAQIIASIVSYSFRPCEKYRAGFGWEISPGPHPSPIVNPLAEANSPTITFSTPDTSSRRPSILSTVR